MGILDLGFLDSSKSYLQTLDEFAKKLQDYDQQFDFYQKQTDIFDNFFHFRELKTQPVEVDYTKYQQMLVQVMM